MANQKRNMNDLSLWSATGLGMQCDLQKKKDWKKKARQRTKLGESSNSWND